jgi:hypothetical protein
MLPQHQPAQTKKHPGGNQQVKNEAFGGRELPPFGNHRGEQPGAAGPGQHKASEGYISEGPGMRHAEHETSNDAQRIGAMLQAEMTSDRLFSAQDPAAFPGHA